MEEKPDEMEDIRSVSSDSVVDDSGGEEALASGEEDGSYSEAPLTEEEIEGLIAELLEVESKAAEAQESLEEESLTKVAAEVREELARTLDGIELENAVAEEMTTFKEEWEAVLDEFETESAHLLEQLDGAGIELPSLYKLIEGQAPNVCCTDAWKKRTHWVGSQVTSDISRSVSDAEKYLQVHRPVRRRHGKILEEGASGFLGKKLANNDSREGVRENSEVDWCSFNRVFDSSSFDATSFGSKQWASVYLASTPQQAAKLGLDFPGINEVEEISDVEGSSHDPFFADAMANEREIDLSEEQRRNFRKVKDEDDIEVDRRLQNRLKRRYRNRSKQDDVEKEASSNDGPFERNVDSLLHCSDSVSSKNTLGDLEDLSSYNCSNSQVNLKNDVHENTDEEKPITDGASSVFSGHSLPIQIDGKGTKRMHDSDEVLADSRKSEMVDQCGSRGNGDDSVIANSVPSQSPNVDVRCTACDKVAIKVHAHPLLNVIICFDCKQLMNSKLQVKDLDCLECYCGWCGQNSDLVSCSSCKMFFCTLCIKRNVGEECLLRAQTSGWKCFCCTPSALLHLTSELEKVIEAADPSLSNSDSDSDSSDSDSDANENVVISSKRRQKKKIRRILDDAELGEETKRKIAIEKERQERLKSLEAKFSTKSMLTTPASFSANLSEGLSVEMLGDVSTGFVVNVVREEGEEAVRIPPSISAKLKVHQIAGIRFMWENIIQSIRKVKSGDKGLGCILAHTMGLGKTFQVITFLYVAMRSVDLGLRTALIVTPLSVLHNWRHEFGKWKPEELKSLRVYMLEDVPRERRADLFAKWRSKGGVFLIGYSGFRNLSLGKGAKDRNMAKEICRALQDGPDILVCDEAHIIKNTNAEITQALKQVKCQRRIALTGSPLQNNLMEYYCMVDFVREGFLGSRHEFRNRFQNPIENGQHTNSTAEDVKIMSQRSHILYEQLKGFVQRMDMNVVKNDLPPKTVYVIAVKLSPLQRKLYKRFLDVHGFTNGMVSSEKIGKSCFFAGYQALAQIWNHPGILQLRKEDRDYVKREDAIENFLAGDSSSDDQTYYTLANGEKLRNKNELPQGKYDSSFSQEDWWNDLFQENNYKDVNYSGKMVLLLDILTICADVGDKVLVFSQSLSTLDLIELFLSKLHRPGKMMKSWKKGKDWYRLDGRTEGSERQKLVERFNNPLNKRVKCTLISTRAGSLGINLHAANRVIIVDGSWNPTYDLQAIYRVWRYGQTKPVFAYRLMAHGTMEEKIYKRQVTKEGLAARVVDRQQVHRTISKEEMLHLFEFGDDENLDTLSDLLGENGNGQSENSMKQKLPAPHGSCFADKLLENLISRHYPRWIANYHEHETLLQENEDEKLSKEEQDMAWEVYRRSLEWEGVPRVPIDESGLHRKQVEPMPADIPCRSSQSSHLTQSVGGSRNRVMPRKCTNLSHLLTLRSQGTKIGCSTVCGECAQEISWDGKSVR